MNLSSRGKSATVNAVTLLLCAVAIGKFDTIIIKVDGQKLEQDQIKNKANRRNLVVDSTFFSIEGDHDHNTFTVRTGDYEKVKPVSSPIPNGGYEGDDYFVPESYPTANVPKMPTPYSPTKKFEPYQPPPPAPYTKPTYRPVTKPSERPVTKPSERPTPRPTPRPSPEPTPRPTPDPTPVPTRRKTPEPTPYPTKPPYPYPKPPYTKPTYPKRASVRTPEPTRTPTKNPTPEPTPRPTSPPTPAPTRSPSSRPSNQPSTRSPTDFPTAAPSSEPSSSPTAVPSRNPTDEPSANPSSSPSASPSAEPSQEPSLEPSDTPTLDPSQSSENPTQSEEPSENPTNSEEPSENPTNSEEPSENPTNSEEPSELLTLTDQPTDLLTEEQTQIDFFNFVEIICDAQNAEFFGILCDIIQQLPEIESRLGDGVGRKLKGGGNVMDDSERFTVFAPTNEAFRRLKLPFDVESEEFTTEEKRILHRIVRYHVLANNKVLSFDELDCNGMLQTLNGEKIQTRCSTNKKLRIQKFQVGNASSAFDGPSDGFVLGKREPKIVSKNIIASNGILHAIDNVILPNLDIPSSSRLDIPSASAGPNASPSTEDEQ